MAKTNFERARRGVSGIALILYVAVAVLNSPPTLGGVKRAMEIAGLVMLILALLGRIWSSLYLAGRKNKVLMNVGPYSLTRNPLYLFSFLAAIGLGLLTQSFVLLIVLIVAYLAYYRFIIADEEKKLEGLFGLEFKEYCKTVPRFFPRLHDYRSVDELIVRPKIFLVSMLDSSWFLWVFVALSTVEAFIERYGSPLPVMWRIW